MEKNTFFAKTYEFRLLRRTWYNIQSTFIQDNTHVNVSRCIYKEGYVILYIVAKWHHHAEEKGFETSNRPRFASKNQLDHSLSKYVHLPKK